MMQRWLVNVRSSAALHVLALHVVASTTIAVLSEQSAVASVRVGVGLFLTLAVLPRLLGAAFGRWGITSYRPSATEPLPLGSWTMLGNPWPEHAVVFAAPYPDVGGAQIPNITYRQSPTLGGLLALPAHILTQRMWHVVTSDERVHSTAPRGSYLMPAIDVSKSRALRDVAVRSTADARVWTRTHVGRARAWELYHWVHESHPRVPLDDWIELAPGRLGVCAAAVRGAAAVLVVAAAAILSRGWVVLVLMLECVVKTAPLWFKSDFL